MFANWKLIVVEVTNVSAAHTAFWTEVALTLGNTVSHSRWKYCYSLLRALTFLLSHPFSAKNSSRKNFFQKCKSFLKTRAACLMCGTLSPKNIIYFDQNKWSFWPFSDTFSTPSQPLLNEGLLEWINFCIALEQLSS